MVFVSGAADRSYTVDGSISSPTRVSRWSRIDFSVEKRPTHHPLPTMCDGGRLVDTCGTTLDFFVQDITGMLRIAIDNDGSATGGEGEEQAQEKQAGGIPISRSPTRPSKTPPSRGRRPQPSNISNNTAAARSGDAGNGEGGSRGAAGVDAGVNSDDDSFGKDSHDLKGFDELDDTIGGVDGKTFSYDDYPAAGSPEEPVWVHTPWCGTNSGDIPVLDKVFENVPGGGKAPPVAQVSLSSSASAPPASSPAFPEAGVNGSSDNRVDSVEKFDGGRSKEHVGEKTRDSHSPSSREQQEFDGGGGDGAGEQGNTAAGISSLGLAKGGEGEGGVDGRRSPRRAVGGGSSPRAVAGGGELKRYDWRADVVPARPSLLATSRIPMGNRADKLKSRNAKKHDNNKKVCRHGYGEFGSMDKRTY